MSNDSYWKEYNDGERAYLYSTDGRIIAFIQRKDGIWSYSTDGRTIDFIQRKDGIWSCYIYEKFISEDFYLKGMDSIKEVEWKVTLYIGNKCDRIANQLHKIRDHLPSVQELADKVMDIKGCTW